MPAAQAADKDHAFFKGVSGDWTGPGEIVAGKFKGTKFVCTFNGAPPKNKVGIEIDGSCRVGMFTQKMSATIDREAPSRYSGKFQDGAEGKGLDIVSGNVVEGNRMVLALNRNQLKGAMLAKLVDSETMTVTISVRVEGQLVPVIGANLKRVDTASTASIPR